MPAWMNEDLQRRREQGLYRKRRRLVSGQGVEIRYCERDFLNFSSNDYLAYAGDVRLARVGARALHQFGSGAGASPLVTGYQPHLRALERDLARWEGTEDALVFPTGYQANIAVVSSLAGREDAIFSDASNHASLIDGCRLSRATVHIYRHKDLSHLEDLLKEHGSRVRRRILVTDTVFSMDGDLADLSELLRLAQQYDALLVIDEAHATGVLGDHGRGLTDSLTDAQRRDDRLIKLGTLSKALGTQGGFVCGSAPVIDWLINHARGYVFSTALAPALAAAARKAIALVQKEPQRRQHVLSLAESLRDQLKKADFDVGASDCHIVPVLIGEAHATLELAKALEHQRILAVAIRPPSVPKDGSRLRLALSAGHTEQDLKRLLTALKECRRTLPT